MKLLTAEQTRTAEQRAIKNGIQSIRLMENAGSAAVNVIYKNFKIENANAVVVVGQGNNGGDGYVVARKLKEYGAKVSVLMVMGFPLTPDSNTMYSKALQAGITIINYYDNVDLADNLISSANLIVDGIFGIGFHGAVDREIASIISKINKASATKISLDLPSGVVCNSGEVLGEAITADITVSFIGYKPCDFLYPATNYCGKTIAVSIGITQKEEDFLAEVISTDQALKMLSDIPSNAHKGTKGTVGILGGSYGMAGAPMISAKAAMRSGGGIVKVAVPKIIYNVCAVMLPEAIFVPLEENDGALCAQSIVNNIFANIKSMLIGPGMGNNKHTKMALLKSLEMLETPVVLDADALNIIASNPNILKDIKVPVIITPHLGEMSKLTGKDISQIEKDRINTALEFSAENGVITVLKGPYTVIATPSGKLYINTTGNEGMATAGSGDMLSGMIAAFLANGISPESAAVAATCLHGAAGDFVSEKMGVRGMMVTDMIEALPYIFKKRFGR